MPTRTNSKIEHSSQLLDELLKSALDLLAFDERFLRSKIRSLPNYESQVELALRVEKERRQRITMTRDTAESLRRGIEKSGLRIPGAVSFALMFFVNEADRFQQVPPLMLSDLRYDVHWHDPVPTCIFFRRSVASVESRIHAGLLQSIPEMVHLGVTPNDLGPRSRLALRDAGLYPQVMRNFEWQFGGDWRALLRDAPALYGVEWWDCVFDEPVPVLRGRRS